MALLPSSQRILLTTNQRTQPNVKMGIKKMMMVTVNLFLHQLTIQPKLKKKHQSKFRPTSKHKKTLPSKSVLDRIWKRRGSRNYKKRKRKRRKKRRKMKRKKKRWKMLCKKPKKNKKRKMLPRRMLPLRIQTVIRIKIKIHLQTKGKHKRRWSNKRKN